MRPSAFRILICEENTELGQILADCFSAFGAQCEVISDTNLLHKQALEKKFDLWIVECHSRNFSLDSIMEIRKSVKPNTPICIFTMNHDLKVPAHIQDMQVFYKPSGFQQLSDLIESYMQTYR